MAARLETLPLLALERVCQYLSHDPEERQRDLGAFSLTSRQCRAAAATQQFRQIHLRIDAADQLESDIGQLSEVLGRHGYHRHVRQLKFSSGRWNTAQAPQDRDRFDVDDFCYPPDGFGQCSLVGGRIRDYPQGCLRLAHFLSQLPGLKDLVWDLYDQFPSDVLPAVAAIGCRLHIHQFRLRSLIQARNNPQPIDPDEYALVRSPSLYSIVVLAIYVDNRTGNVDYTTDAVKGMMAGTTPNLAHVWLASPIESGWMSSNAAIRLDMPAWRGFFPTEGPQLPVPGNLQSLVLQSGRITTWRPYTDLTRLRRLSMNNSNDVTGFAVSLAEAALSGDLKSLDTLRMSWYRDDDVHQTQEALRQALEHMSPLQRLNLKGFLSNKFVLDPILHRHGEALRSLSLCPVREIWAENPVFNFTDLVISQLVESCPNLEHLDLPINRTRGDNRETSIYRALGTLRRLRRVSLVLQYSLGPDPDFWDDERDGEYPLPHDLAKFEYEHLPHLCEAYSNCALDSTLALSIFDLISSSRNGLRYLSLVAERKSARNQTQAFWSSFEIALRWLHPSWVCERDAQGNVTIRERNKEARLNAEDDWVTESEDELDLYKDAYRDAFIAVWPKKTREWWKDWKSLPLSVGPGSS